MVGFPKLTGFAVAAACLISPSFAHPGETHDAVAMKREIHARNVMASAAKRSLGACSDNLEARNLFARNIARRSNVARELRQKRNIKSKAKKFRRDLATLETYEAINHNQTGVYTYTPATPETTVFAANTSCILTPEVTDGPYYVWGEMIRKNVKEDEYSDGVDLYLEVQYLDINTCQPVPNVYVDIWNANATGVYSGISESGNYAADGWNSTYLRGIQVTDEDGVASFETIFPGHYEGRATHTHLLAHMNVTVNDNGTLALDTGSVTHIGQLFWNEVLRSAVEDTYPYNTNTQAITTNTDDMWSIVQAENDYDPFPEYLYLGDDVTDGLFAWIQIGVNVSADYTDNSYYSIAAYLEADGGHENESSGFTGGSGGPNSTTTVFEARLEQAGLLKRVVDAIKDLVQDCNFDCNDSGIALQAMDNSHVALVSMMLNADAFSPYRCDRTVALGINLLSLTKVLRAAQNEDILTLKAEDSPDVVNLMFESSETDRLSEYDIKLMDIDQEHLAIPETDYAATVSMPSVEFQRICRDLNALSESVVIEATKEGIKFSCQGDIGNGAVTIRQHTNVEDPTKNVSIQLTEPVALTFSLKYLVNFCKATALSGQVKLCLSQEVPLQVEYSLSGSSGSAASGHLRFFLAPKIGDEE